MTNAERFRRHLAPSALCSICYHDVEDLDHIFRPSLQARNLWDRCTAIFDSENTHTKDILARGVRLFEECNHAFACTSGQGSLVIMPQAWSKPPPGWIKANVDASASLADGKAAIGIADRLAALGRSSSSIGLSLPSPTTDLALLIEEEKDRSTGAPEIPWAVHAAANVAYFSLHSDLGG
ncbi:hypothetical protein V6N11_056938 [Hibiscus sabdariffa]|uniref:Uncharacterized protein n=1 Tax=Hibiscus sabdariffa TaxID=183260 RepID=A0ABR2T5A4_9ROSI